MEIKGRGGVSLNDAWSDGAEAHLGMTVPGFPNFFMLYGPNTSLGHNSVPRAFLRHGDPKTAVFGGRVLAMVGVADG